MSAFHSHGKNFWKKYTSKKSPVLFWAAFPNSFVTLAYEANAFREPKVVGKGRVGKPVHRNWGILLSQRGLVLSNHYIHPIDTVYPALVNAAPGAFNLPTGLVYEKKPSSLGNPFEHFSGLGYVNGDPTVVRPQNETAANLGSLASAVGRGYRNNIPF